MSHYLIELYTPNSAWNALSKNERKQYLGNVATAMGGLLELGVKPLTLTQIDTAVEQHSEHLFVAVWHFPNLATRDALLSGIKASGWYNYFSHVNAAGIETSFAEHLDALCNI